jgi:hypothetical protein
VLFDNGSWDYVILLQHVDDRMTVVFVLGPPGFTIFRHTFTTGYGRMF